MVSHECTCQVCRAILQCIVPCLSCVAGRRCRRIVNARGAAHEAISRSGSEDPAACVVHELGIRLLQWSAKEHWTRVHQIVGVRQGDLLLARPKPFSSLSIQRTWCVILVEVVD